MHNNRFFDHLGGRRAKLLAAALVGVLAPAGAVAAGDRPHVDLSGKGTYELVELDLFARGDAQVGRRPFDGSATFMLRTDDGSFPAPGECEPGAANFAVTGKGRQALSGVSLGEVCGEWVQEPTSVVTHVFVGRYSIVESTPRLNDTEGWIEIRLALGNRTSITLFDS